MSTPEQQVEGMALLRTYGRPAWYLRELRLYAAWKAARDAARLAECEWKSGEWMPMCAGCMELEPMCRCGVACDPA